MGQQLSQVYSDSLKHSHSLIYSDCYETCAVALSLEAPGMNSEDLDIQVTADTVSVSGERKEKTVTEEKGMSQTEFHYGRFQRVIPLPTRIQNNNVEAEYKDGILKLVMPKAEEEKNKIVKVNLS